LDSLAVSFNRMAEQLAAARAETEAHRHQLEARIAERTLQLKHLAERDPLTELPNRRQLFSQLDAGLRHAATQASRVGVFILDLDNFKNINDSAGHAYGDRVLQSVAQRLEEAVTGKGYSARLGGDEFTIVHENAASNEEIRLFGEQLLQAFQKPLSVDGRELLMSVSLGASFYPEHAQSAEELLRDADAALFRAKQLGRNQLNIFSPELLAAAASRFSTEQALRHAIERGDFELAFQPEVRIDTLEVTLVEALLRWRLPDGRQASTAEFLAVAEDSGLILEISDWVLRSAIEAAAALYRGPWPQACVAINVSARQLLDRQFVARVQELLRQHSLPAECIEIELTENVLQTGRSTIDALSALRALGAGIALDDFGTGFSSLTSLEQLPLTRVKLDRSLITCIDSNARAFAIAQSIIELGERLGLKMTAEGIERPEQLCMLWAHEKLHLQGYLLSRAVSIGQLPGVIADLPMRMRSLLLSAPSATAANRGEPGILLPPVAAIMSSR
jgi:diguanylate cyclase (GGDEF)-like protein